MGKTIFKSAEHQAIFDKQGFIDQKEIPIEEHFEFMKKHNSNYKICLKNNEFVGLVSNADVRKSLLNSIDDLTNLNVTSMINTDSVEIQERATVNDMLQLIKKYAFLITYLPVLDEAKNAVGIVTFVNLIRGEI